MNKFLIFGIIGISIGLIAIIIYDFNYDVSDSELSESELSESEINLQTMNTQEISSSNVSWNRIWNDANYARTGLIQLRDSFSPPTSNLTVIYDSLKDEDVGRYEFGLLDSSLWSYLITGDDQYLIDAKMVADDIEKYMITRDDVKIYLTVTGDKKSFYRVWEFPTENRYLIISLSRLAMIDDNYSELVSKLTDAMIRNEINSETNLFYTSIYPKGEIYDKTMYFSYGGDVGIEALLWAFMATNNERYLEQAKNTILQYWDLRDKNTNLIPSWVYADTGEIKENYMQQYGAGAFLKVLLHYYYLTDDEKFLDIIDTYSNSISTYFWDGMTWNYRVDTNGKILSPLIEANYPKLDDAFFLIHSIDPVKYNKLYDLGKSDFDNSFLNGKSVTNGLIKHGVRDDGTDDGNHQAMITYAFPVIQNVAMRLYKDTGNSAYYETLESHYISVIDNHKRKYGYVTAIDPYTLETDEYHSHISDSGTGFIANKIFLTIKPSPDVNVYWTQIGSHQLDQPFLVTFHEAGWFNMIKFDLKNNSIFFEKISGTGTITFEKNIKQVLVDNKPYDDYTQNILNIDTDSSSVKVFLVN